MYWHLSCLFIEYQFKFEMYKNQHSEIENSLQYSNSLPERVRVSVRLRPLLEEENNSKDRQICVEQLDVEKNCLIIKKDFEKKQFQFDHIFDPKASQQMVYNRIAKPVIDSVLKGINGTIFCYGATGTGKTYTMMGNPESDQRGIIPRSLEQIFQDVAKDKQNHYSIQMAYLQIYMEMLMDLIKPENNEIKIREDPDQGVFISGLEWISVEGPLECLKVLSYAEKNRIMGFTNLNAHSSRSHSMLMVKIEKRQTSLSNSTNSIRYSKQIKSTSFISQDHMLLDDDTMNIASTLYLVDLAGSERVKKSRASGDRLSEARSINCSLSALGKCIHALTDPKTTFVPFRDSKLTRILQDSLGGNCKTSLIVNIGPSSKQVDETLSSLVFGMRAMKVQNMPTINLNKKSPNSSTQLQQEIDTKDNLISKLEISQHKLVQQVHQLQVEIQQLKDQKVMGSQLQSLSLSSHDADMETHYRQQIQKMEEDHKAFLEEIDKMMLEQEKENDSLKQEVEVYQEKCGQLEHLNQQHSQYKSELLETIQELHQVLDEKDAEMKQWEKCYQNQEKEVKSLKEANQQLYKELQSVQKNQCMAQEIVMKSKEKLFEEWKAETEVLTEKYAKMMEEKKRVEMELQEKQRHQENQKQLKNELRVLQQKLQELESENHAKDAQARKESEEERERLVSRMRGEQEELRRRLEEEYRADREKNASLQNAVVDLTKRLEQYEQKLRKQRENYETQLQQQKSDFEQLECIYQSDKESLKEEYAQFREQSGGELLRIRAEFQELSQASKCKLEQKAAEVQELQRQLHSLERKKEELQLEIGDHEKQAIRQQEEIFILEEQLETLRSQLSSLQIRIEDANYQKDSMVHFIKSKVSDSQHIDFATQFLQFTDEQNFQLNNAELKKSISLRESAVLVDMQAQIAYLEEQLARTHRDADAHLHKLLAEQEHTVAALSQHHESLLQEKNQHLAQLQKELHRLQEQVSQQNEKFEKIQNKSQQAVERMQDVMICEIVKGVVEKMVIQVEFNALQQDDDTSIYQSNCQTPITKTLNDNFFTETHKHSANIVYSIHSDHDDDDFKMHNRSFQKRKDSLSRNLQNQLVESLFIDDNCFDSQCSPKNMPIIEQSDESVESDSDENQPPAKNISKQKRQALSEPNDNKTVFPLPEYFMRSTFKIHNEDSLLDQIIVLAKSHSQQHSSIRVSSSFHPQESLYSFSEKDQAESKKTEQEVFEVMDRILFLVESQSEFETMKKSLIEKASMLDQCSIIKASHQGSEMISLKNSFADEISFQLNFGESSNQVIEKFMSQVKQRKISILENVDLSVDSIQQVNSNQKQELLKAQLIKTLQQEKPCLQDITNQQDVKSNDIEQFFQKIEKGAFDKQTIIHIIQKLLQCAESAHEQYVEKLIKKYQPFYPISLRAKHLLVVEELEEIIRLMAIMMMDKQKMLQKSDSKMTTEKIQKFAKSLQDKSEITKETIEESVQLVQQSNLELGKLSQAMIKNFMN